MRLTAALLFMVLLLNYPSDASAQDAESRTRVVILGVNHSTQLLAEGQRPAVLRAFFERVAPDGIAVERDPQSFARNDFYDTPYTYEIQELAVPWARERGTLIHPFDWLPPTEDQRLLVGLDLEAVPLVRPLQGFGGFQAFTDSTILTAGLFYAEVDGYGDEVLEWADTPAANGSHDSGRRLFLYRTFMQARRIAHAAANHRDGTLLVVVGHMHKPDLERILGEYPFIELVRPSEYGEPTAAEVAAQERTPDLHATAVFNLLGVQPIAGVVDYSYVERVIARLEGEVGSIPEVRLLRTRLGVLTNGLGHREAAAEYRRIQRATDSAVPFVWTGVSDRSRLDSFHDPFGNMTVRQRAALELARELYALGEVEEADSIAGRLVEEFAGNRAVQFRAYWREHVRGGSQVAP